MIWLNLCVLISKLNIKHYIFLINIFKVRQIIGVQFKRTEKMYSKYTQKYILKSSHDRINNFFHLIDFIFILFYFLIYRLISFYKNFIKKLSKVHSTEYILITH